MPTSRTLTLLLAGALFGTAGIVEMGCATDSGDEAIGEEEGELGASPSAAGIVAGSLEEEGVLLLVNDRAVTVDVLKTRTKVSARVAEGILAFRTTPEGAPRWFSTIDEIDALPQTGTVTFQRLVADANASGYTEAPGFDPPTRARISVPENLGRPPTSNDVVVEAGFDGKPVDEAALLVRARLTNTVAPGSERFVEKTIKDNHKAFTLAVGNLFAQGSPHASFVRSLDAEKLTLLGTMSAVKPTILLAEKAGAKSYYARGASGRYESIEVPSYPVIMRAKIRLATAAENDPGPGVRVFYPAWSAKVLSGPATVPDAGSGDAGGDAAPSNDAGGDASDAGLGANDGGPGASDASAASDSGADAGSASDGGTDAGTGTGSGPSGTNLAPPVEEGAPQDESTPDPMAEPDGEPSKSGSARSEEALITTKKSSDAGGCAATPRGASHASWALLAGAVALGSLRRRRR